MFSRQARLASSLAALLVTSNLAWAIPQPNKIPRPAKEVYPATESEDTVPVSIPVSVATPQEQEVTPPVPAKKAKPSHRKVRSVVAATNSKKSVARDNLEKRLAQLEREVGELKTKAPAKADNKDHEAFDLVPNDQTDAIVKRLQLTQKIVEKYGRAYDYRAFTTQRLEKILAQLEVNQPKTEPAIKTVTPQTVPVAPQTVPVAPLPPVEEQSDEAVIPDSDSAEMVPQGI